MGMRMAKQMIYTGQNIKAEEALRIGLVNSIYPQNELLNEDKKLANIIGKNYQNAIKNSKKARNIIKFIKKNKIKKSFYFLFYWFN